MSSSGPKDLVRRSPWQLRYWRVIPRHLEAEYEFATLKGRNLRAQFGLALGVFVVLAALYFDHTLGPDAFAVALPMKALHVAVSLAAIWLLARPASVFVSEAIVTFANLIPVCGGLAIAMHAPEPYNAIYIMLCGVYACFVNFVFELRIEQAIRTSLVMTAAFFSGGSIVALQLSDDLSSFGAVVYLLSFACLVVVVVPLQNERAKRQAFFSEIRVRRAQEALKSANMRLNELLHVDALTGVNNRRSFDIELRRRIESACSATTHVGLILIDVDHFKSYNDHFGHQAGDDCLQKVAQCLAKNTRPGDLVCRYGGEEFVVLLEGINGEAVANGGERLRAAVEAMNLPHPQEDGACVTISAGVVSAVPVAADAGEDLLRVADAALYASKRDGRNRVTLLADLTAALAVANPCSGEGAFKPKTLAA